MKPRASLNGPRSCFAVFLGAVILALAGYAAEPAPGSAGGPSPGQSTLSQYLTRPAFKPVVMTPVVATNAPASPWGYWLARNATAASQASQTGAALGEPNDCYVCKDLPKPRKCCGVCGRVNECELCATGAHPLPGGLKAGGGGGAESAANKSARAEKSTCTQDCGFRPRPHDCCWECYRAWDCLLCVLGKHHKGWHPALGEAIFNAAQPAFARPLNTSGNGPFFPVVQCFSDCMLREYPRPCCPHCRQSYECKLCAAGQHFPGGGRVIDREGYRLLSAGKAAYIKRGEKVGLGPPPGSLKPAPTKASEQPLGGSLMVWEVERQLRGLTNAPATRP